MRTSLGTEGAGVTSADQAGESQAAIINNGAIKKKIIQFSSLFLKEGRKNLGRGERLIRERVSPHGHR